MKKRIRLVTLLAAIAVALAISINSGAESTNPRQLPDGVPATDVQMGSLLLREDIAVPATTAETEAPIRAAGFIEPTQPTQIAPTLRSPTGDRGSAAEVLALLGFLVLISGLLIHWSRDTSCKDDRSVFPS